MNWTELRETSLPKEQANVIPPNIKLPMLPTVVIEFSRQAEDPDVNSKKLASIVETDTGYTVELLRHVNSSVFGLRTKASTVQQAINLLGSRTVKYFLLTTGMKSALQARQSKLINLKNFWANNLERALFAREVARMLRADMDLAFAAAMLQDSLLPILSNELYDIYVKYCEIPEESPINITAFEEKAFRWNHSMATASVMHNWGFPDDLVCCILYHHQGLKVLADKTYAPTALAAVAVATLLPDPILQEHQGLLRLHKLQGLWPNFNLKQLIERVDAQYQELSPGVASDFTLKHRYEKMLPQLEAATAAAAAPSA